MKGFKLTSCNFCTGGMFWYVIRSSSFGASIWKCERNESVSIRSTSSDRGLKSSPAIRDSVRLLCINLYWPACHLQLLLFSLFTFLFCPANLLVTFSLFFWLGGIVFELMFQTNLLAGVFMKCDCIQCVWHQRAGAERLIFASLLIMHIHPAMLINMTAYLRRTALDQEVLLIQISWSFS